MKAAVSQHQMSAILDFSKVSFSAKLQHFFKLVENVFFVSKIGI